MKKNGILLLLILPLWSIAQQRIDLRHPPDTAALFAPGFVTTGLKERDFALSPDGQEMFFTLQAPLGIFQTIVYSKKNANGEWSKPEIAPFAGMFSDLESAFSTDGTVLFFSSNRPLQGDKPKDFDIWYSEKKNGRWGAAKNVGAPVNTSADEYYPAITQSGNLYFTASYDGKQKEDIFKATFNDGRYTNVTPLDSAVNSSTYEFNAYVSPDEQLIIFTSYGRKDDKGKGDLYISWKDSSGHWQPAKNMVSINSDKLDYCPFVSFDKKILFFTSERCDIPSTYPANGINYKELTRKFLSPKNGSGDVYWVNFGEKLKIQN